MFPSASSVRIEQTGENLLRQLNALARIFMHRSAVNLCLLDVIFVDPVVRRGDAVHVTHCSP